MGTAKQTPDCKTCLNTNCLVRKSFAIEYKKEYNDKKLALTFRSGQQFILEGAPVQGLFFVYKGAAKVTRPGQRNRQRIVRFATRGDVIGHRGFGTEDVYPIGAEALEETVLCNFSNETFNQMLRDMPELAIGLMHFYAKELHNSEVKVRMFSRMQVRDRVIYALLYIYEVFGQRGDFMNIVLSRRAISDLADTNEEQVIRTLSTLKKQKLIRTEGKKIGLIERATLVQEIEEYLKG